jgi:hypothetical protein
MRSFLLIAMVLLLASCEEEEEVTYDIKGEFGELSVYIPAEFREKGIEDKLEEHLLVSVLGLMIEEKSLKLKFVTEGKVEALRDRNILEINIGSDHKTEFFVKKQNPKIPEQYHIILYASSVDDALALIEEKGKMVEQGVNAREDDRIKAYINRKRRPEIAKNIKKAMDVRMVIPREYNHMVVNDPDFSYVKGTDNKIGMKGKMLIQNFLFVINIPDDQTEMAMNMGKLSYVINSYLRKNVGYDTGTDTDTAFMQLSPQKDYPMKVTKRVENGRELIDFSGRFGIYKSTMEQVPFGGAFTGKVIRDEAKNRIVIVIGACNVPAEFGYRENLRLLQGMVNSVRV